MEKEQVEKLMAEKLAQLKLELLEIMYPQGNNFDAPQEHTQDKSTEGEEISPSPESNIDIHIGDWVRLKRDVISGLGSCSLSAGTIVRICYILDVQIVRIVTRDGVETNISVTDVERV